MDKSLSELKKYLFPFLKEEEATVIINFFNSASSEGKKLILADLKQLYEEEMADQERLKVLTERFNQLLNNPNENQRKEEVSERLKQTIKTALEQEKNNLAKIAKLRDKLRRFFK